jgi:hypothetical protein
MNYIDLSQCNMDGANTAHVEEQNGAPGPREYVSESILVPVMPKEEEKVR